MINRALLYIAFSLALLKGYAQPGALDLTFNPGSGIPSGYIQALALQGDGKILAGGVFPSFNGTPAPYLARLLPNGLVDTAFHIGSGANWIIHSLVVQPDGKIIVGGEFWIFDSTGASGIVRLNSNGSVDTTFHIGTGFNGSVHVIALQTDGKILAGGEFTSYDSVACGRLMRLNADGSPDSTFSAVPGAGSTVEAIALQPDHKIVIAGDFDSYDNDTLFRIARLNPDGSGDAYYNRLGGFDKVVSCLALTPDTGVIASGNFTSWDYQTQYNKIAKIENNGTAQYGFETGNPGPGPGNVVDDVLIMDSNKVLISGNFTSFGGIADRIAQVNSSAQFDSSFNTGTGCNDEVYKLGRQADGKILIAGRFTAYNGTPINSIARLFNCTTPQPGPITGNTNYSCPGAVLTYSISPVAGASSYKWSLPSGWSGSSDSASITVTTADTGGIVSVRAYNDSCGYSAAQTLVVQIMRPPPVPVCLVTVDSQSLYNILIWEKPHNAGIDSFYIYRQDTSFIFTKIAAIPYDSLSEYADTTAAANPNATAHQYKISGLDTCGVESPLSDYHSTIFLQDLGNGNLLWAPYEIENALNPVTFYRVYRDNLGNGNFIPLNVSIPGGNTSFTDVDAALYPNANYVLDVNWSISCTPTRAVNTTRSNIKHTKSLEAINEITDADIKIYPNPASTAVTIYCPLTVKIQSLQIMDLLGETIYNEPDIHNQTNRPGNTINTQSLRKGVYMIKIETDKGGIVRKLVIE